MVELNILRRDVAIFGITVKIGAHFLVVFLFILFFSVKVSSHQACLLLFECFGFALTLGAPVNLEHLDFGASDEHFVDELQPMCSELLLLDGCLVKLNLQVFLYQLLDRHWLAHGLSLVAPSPLQSLFDCQRPRCVGMRLVGLLACSTGESICAVGLCALGRRRHISAIQATLFYRLSDRRF